MIITLTGADFSKNNIGVLNSWRIVRALQGVSTNSAVTSVTKGGTYSATFTVNTDYTRQSCVITMGGTDITNTAISWNGNVGTISNLVVTGNLYISIIATANSPAVTKYTFTISPSPSSATVMINGQNTTSVMVDSGTIVSWSVAASGYISQSGNYQVNSNYVMTVALSKESPTQQQLSTPNIYLTDGLDALSTPVITLVDDSEQNTLQKPNISLVEV